MPKHARTTEEPAILGAAPRRLRFVSALVAVSLLSSSPHIGALEHTVVSGEVLSTIAELHSTSVEAIVAANGLSDPNVIFSGQTLTIPTDPIPLTATEQTHVVRSGDTLWDIALTYGVPVGALARFNSIEDAGLIRSGQALLLPGPDGTALVTVQPFPSRSDEAGPTRHVVEVSDTMWGIAQLYSTDLNTLLRLNDIDSTALIQPGQQITLTGAAPDTGSKSDAVLYPLLPADLSQDPDRLALMDTFDRWALAYDVPAELMKALAWFESGWNNEVRSSAGAVGIGQVLPISAVFISDVLLHRELDLEDPQDNIRLSTRYMRYLLDNTDGVESAVASYYQGLTATRQHGIYSSSQFYVDGVLALRARFELGP